MDSPSPDPRSSEITALLARASHHGLILPGAAAATWDPLPAIRSGRYDTAGSAGLRSILRDLQSEDESSPSAAVEIAGYLALDDLPMADIRLQRVLGEDETDPDLLLVAGILAYRQSRLEQSRQYLQRVLDVRPDDPAARFDLALILSETGSVDRARAMFRTLADRRDLPLVSHRAEIELARLRDLHPEG